MYRGILELKKDEFDELFKMLVTAIPKEGLLYSKLQDANENTDEIKTISVSEEDLEFILDSILPIDPNNQLLKMVFEKISEQLRNIRN
ncbi:hypothetical protein GX656_03500 [Candidatus Dojkabacteria bacterium]|uniref:Uncharacterized protein n=1 Tax=Candidatus Dojkabacteria bacterium TaxID=2099670 RepID=A0A847D1Y1_9BACT|nr:hypothetical protein [Candidatus Dojkabacteria bacterium]